MGRKAAASAAPFTLGFREGRRRGDDLPSEDHLSPVHDGPLDRLTFDEVARVGDRSREVDIPLLRSAALNQLHGSGITHSDYSIYVIP
jgi:hypothetical protein